MLGTPRLWVCRLQHLSGFEWLLEAALFQAQCSGSGDVAEPRGLQGERAARVPL